MTRSLKRTVVAGSIGLALFACTSGDAETQSPPTSTTVPPSSTAAVAESDEALVRCYSDDSLSDGSSWVVEFSTELDSFVSLEGVPSTNEFGEPATHHRLGLGTIDEQQRADVRIVRLPFPIAAIEKWQLSDGEIRRPNGQVRGDDRIGREGDCSGIDLDGALTTLHELEGFYEEMRSELGVVDGSPRRVATIATPEPSEVEVYVDFPGANTSTLPSELNNLLATGRMVEVEGEVFSEVVGLRPTRVHAPFWIATNLLVESKSLSDIAASGGLAVGVLDSAGQGSTLSIEGAEFLVADAVVIEVGTLFSRGTAFDEISTLDQARDVGLLDQDGVVEVTVNPNGQIVGLLIVGS